MKFANAFIFCLSIAFVHCKGKARLEGKGENCKCSTGISDQSKYNKIRTESLINRDLYLLMKKVVPDTVESIKLGQDSFITRYQPGSRIFRLNSDSTFSLGNIFGRWKVDTSKNEFYFYKSTLCPCDSSFFLGASGLLFSKNPKLFSFVHSYSNEIDSSRYNCGFLFTSDPNYGD